MSSGLRPVAARRHVTPPASAVLRTVEEHTGAARVGAAANARELAEDEGIRRRLDDRDHEAGEGVSDRNERALEGAVAARLEATGAGASAEDAVDLVDGVEPNLHHVHPALGERPEGGTDAPRVSERRGSAGRLLKRPPADATPALSVQHRGTFEPAYERIEIPEEIDAAPAARVVGVDEIQPEPLAEKRERDDLRHGCERERHEVIFGRGTKHIPVGRANQAAKIRARRTGRDVRHQVSR